MFGMTENESVIFTIGMFTGLGCFFVGQIIGAFIIRPFFDGRVGHLTITIGRSRPVGADSHPSDSRDPA